MAGPDPRRSARARTSQPLSRPSSTASSVSGRIDRPPRSATKAGSPRKSASAGSLASEPPDDGPGTATDDSPPPPTRSRRATHIHASKDDDQDQDLSSAVFSEIEMANDDDMQEDDEAVRCICGYDDYPGPPAPEDLKQAAKDGYDVESIFPSVVTDNLAGFFVQCDICKVWQHGACVGLVNDKTLPEEYYCEECRKDFHKVLAGTTGPRCSIYLALNGRRSRTSSFAKDREQSPVKARDSSKSGKSTSKDTRQDADKDTRNERPSSSVSMSSKRRSTMNSRDAAYDEEQLRLAMEASKENVSGPTSVDGSSRRPKRGRSDSEEKSDGIKRQRTSSRSASPENSAEADDSDDALATRNGSSRKLSRNAAAARSQQQREKTEREEKERQRAEAANKRNGRAERRRTDDADSDPSDEIPLAATRASASSSRTAPNTTASATTITPVATAAISSNGANAGSASSQAVSATAPPTSLSSSSSLKSGPARPSQPTPETPPPTSAPAMATSKSRGGRPTHKKKGRNQYTKERDAREEQSATRSRSRDVLEIGHNQIKSGMGGGGSGSHGSNSKSNSRSKGNANSRISLPEMRRRMAAMSEFIGKTQIEIAGGEYLAPATPLPHSGSSVKGTPPSNTTATTPVSTVNGDSDGNMPKRVPEIEFRELPLVDMMDVLTRNIIHWQATYEA